MVSYVDYPDYSIHSHSLELVKEFFETTVSSSVESVDGKLRYSTESKINDYPGVIWRVDYNGGKAIVKSKAFLVGRRFSSIQAIAFREKSLSDTIDKFQGNCQRHQII